MPVCPDVGWLSFDPDGLTAHEEMIGQVLGKCCRIGANVTVTESTNFVDILVSAV